MVNQIVNHSSKKALLIVVALFVIVVGVSVYCFRNDITILHLDNVRQKVDSQNFQDLINKDKYQVFVFSSPASFPINFARHPWFVINKKGVISRWEVMHFENKTDRKLEHIHFNARSPFGGNIIIYPLEILFWKTELMGYIEGGEESDAKKAIEFIENSMETYPYYDRYNFLGPNSNTYLQNVLNKFPEFNIKLSWNFIGKDYEIQKQ